MPLTDDQLARVLQQSMFDPKQWVEAGRYMAEGMKGAGGFSSSNVTGAAGGRGVEGKLDETYRKYDSTLKSEIKLRKLSSAANESVAKTLKAFDKAIQIVHPEMKSFAQDIRSISGVLDTQFQRISDSFTDAGKEIEYWTKLADKSGISIFKLDHQLRRVNTVLMDQEATADEHKEAEEELIDIQKKRAKLLKAANPDLKEFIHNVKLAGAALVTAAGVAANQMFGDVEAMRRFGTPGGMFQQFKAGAPGGALMGIDPQLISELMASNRATVIAMGGAQDMGAYYDSLGARLNELALITGNRTEALKFEMETYQSLLRSGIMPTEDALNGVVKEFAFFQQAMGMTHDEFTQRRNSLSQNVEIRRTLQGIDKRDLSAKINGIIAQMQTNRELGMMREQAIAAATALHELGAKGPRERIKDMAKLQAIGAMAGVQMSDEARKAFILGRSATDAQRKAQSEFMGTLGGSLANISATMGGEGAEFAMFAMMEKAGIGMERFDQFMPQLGEKISELPKNFEEAFLTMSEQMGPLETQFSNLKNVVEEVVGVFSNVAGGGFLSNALGTATGAFLGTGGAKGLFSGISRLFAGVGGLGTAMRAAPTIGAAGLGTATLGVGGAALGGYAVGSAINNFAKLWGGRQLSTTILDAFTGFNDYDPNADTPGVAQTAEKTAELVEPAKETAVNSGKQLSVQEKQLEVMITTAELQAGAIDNQKALNRLDRLDREGQYASTID